MSTPLDIRTIATEARHQLLLDAVTDYAIYMLDPSGHVVSWNSGAQRFKGYEPEEIVGRHFSTFYTEEDRSRGEPERALSTAAAEGKFETEAWRVRKDGTQFWASVVIDAIRDPNGHLLGFAKITRDITERMRVREALLESERRFRILVQGVADYAIFMLDPDGRITNWNLGAERIKKYTAEEIVGQHFSRFYTDEDRATGLPYRALEIAAREGKFEAEGWRVRKDGTRFWAGVLIDAIRDPDGTLVGFAKITRDLSERKQAAEELEKARQALFQAQKMEAIGQLTGGVAHDFNNLLTVIISSLEMLRRRVTDPRDVRMLENALLAADRGSQLTSQLLAFARRQALRPEPHNPNQLIDTFEAILRRAGGSDISVELKLASDIGLVLVDPAQFESALLNLVVNARDACGDAGGITVTTEMVEVDVPRNLILSTMEPGCYVCVSVADTGEGMTPQTLAHACEPFFTTKEIGKGTGLGLSQVYGFVSQSDGHIHIESEPGKGTTVSLYLPAHDENSAGESHEKPQTETVLIVDDDPQVMGVAVDMFGMMGYDVLTANDANEALDVLMRDRRVDLLFSDVVMPHGMNGAELAKEARNLRPDIRVILASGYPAAALEQSGASLADAGFVAKPYRWTDIENVLTGLSTD